MAARKHIQVLEHAPLLPYNTFGIAARAARFAAVSSVAELQTVAG